MDPAETPSFPPSTPPPTGTPAPTVNSPQSNINYTPPWEKKAQINEEAHSIATARAEVRARRQRSSRFRTWRKYFIWSALIYFVYWFYTPHGIFVLGDPLSVARYRGVLMDLKTEMPTEYAMVRDYIDKIKISYIITGGNYAGYAQESEPGTKSITLLENTFIKGPGFAQSTLVHEACHGLQFAKELPFSPFCENQAREYACNQIGLKVLRHFKADPDRLNYYEDLAQGDSVYGNSCLREGKRKTMPEL